jgi:Nis1 family
MRFQTILAAGASLLTLSSARIVGIAVPETIKPGDTFNAIIEVENYIQSVYDVAIAFGITPGSGYPGSLGTPITSGYLGPDHSNTLQNISYAMTMPASTAAGQAKFAAALLSLYGAVSDPTITSFNVSVTIGDSTSSNLVSSNGFSSVSA